MVVIYILMIVFVLYNGMADYMLNYYDSRFADILLNQMLIPFIELKGYRFHFLIV